MGRLLTGIAFLVALALSAALLVPPLVNWENLRPVFVEEATARLGQPVTVKGPISLQILPSPKLTAHEVSIGNERSAYRLEAVRIDADLGFAALTGEKAAVTGVTLHEPRFSIVSEDVLSVFTGDWSRAGLSNLSIVNGVVERGLIPIVQNISIDIGQDDRGHRLSGSADFRAVRWEATGTLGRAEAGGLHPFRLRLIDAAAGVDVLLAGQGISTGTGVNATSSVTVRGKSVGSTVTSLGMLTGLLDPQNVGGLESWTKPVSLSADVQMTPEAMRANGLKIDLADARFEGTGLVTLGERSQVNLELAAQTFAVDKMFGPDVRVPLGWDAWHLFAPRPVRGALSSVNGGVSIRIASLLWGETVIQDFAVKAGVGDGLASLRGLMLTLPGGARASLDLSPASADEGAALTGAFTVSADHPRTFFEWLGVPTERVAHGVVTRFGAQAGLTLDGQAARFDDISLEIGDATATGRLHMPVPGVAARHVDVEFDIRKLNVDAFRRLMTSQVTGDTMKRLHAMLGDNATGRIQITARELTLIGNKIGSGMLALDLEDGLAKIDEAYVRDYMGFDASGRGAVPLGALDPSAKERHRLELRIDGREPGKLIEALDLSEWLPADGISGMSLDVNLTLGATDSDFVALGQAGKTELSLVGAWGRAPSGTTDANGQLGTVPAWRLSIQARNPDGNMLAYQLGLTGSRDPATDTVGELDIDLATEGGKGPIKVTLNSSVLQLNVGGTFDWQDTFEGFAGFVTFEAPKAQALKGTQWMHGPLILKGEIEATPEMARISELNGTVAEALIEGTLSVDFAGDKPAVDGRLGVDALDIRSVAAVNELSKPSKPTDLPPWSTQLFRSDWFDAVTGQIEFDASLLSFGTHSAQDMGAAVVFGEDGLRIRKLTAAAFGGQVKGSIHLSRRETGMGFEVDLEGDGVDLSELGALLSATLSGSSTVSLKATGQGSTVFDMVSSLSGGVSITTPQGHFGQIDAAVFADGWPLLETLGAFNSLVKSATGKDVKTPFTDLEGRILIKDGVMTFENFSGQSAAGPMALTGRIDLPGYIVDLTAGFAVAENTPELDWTLSGSLSAPREEVNAADLRLAFARRIRDSNAGRITEDNLPKEIQELLKVLDELEGGGDAKPE